MPAVVESDRLIPAGAADSHGPLCGDVAAAHRHDDQGWNAVLFDDRSKRIIEIPGSIIRLLRVTTCGAGGQRDGRNEPRPSRSRQATCADSIKHEDCAA